MKSWHAVLLWTGLVAIAISVNVNREMNILKSTKAIEQLQTIIFESDLWPAGVELPEHLKDYEE